ncbi:hypothetical protein ROZALSC1DRAFT_26931 [Rozella allomycis CSF55]|uniref:Uncharacterized protein n=1 Tax=Rozella allomycis (strain CSF55) TaxID=988480 RepID=A0A075B0L7_ROZAC|nr:hypothetical protein O9G_006046 [Rozella allomycis CSF55]RKP21676.1 hypothetical protein ROZALSC1DRAFT_26931 [Rozella allomycis CSF55]|eukprot:EPZ36071.1 hypothetical protein O9G_006046 [Rozella allomycis CSF55]
MATTTPTDLQAVQTRLNKVQRDLDDLKSDPDYQQFVARIRDHDASVFSNPFWQRYEKIEAQLVSEKQGLLSLMKTGMLVEEEEKFANFHFYYWNTKSNATKPYKKITLMLVHGKIYLKSLLEDEEASEIFLKNGHKQVKLQYDSNGLSVKTWRPDETYHLIVKKPLSVDIQITFSEKNEAKLNVLIVKNDFNLEFHDSEWTMSADYAPVDIPIGLCEALKAMGEFNSLRKEMSRRSVVSVFIHFVLSSIPQGKAKLCVDEEPLFQIVRECMRDDGTKHVQYSGPLDFVIGHSRVAEIMPSDAAVIVVETKKSDAFDKSLPQALAQAATVMHYRRSKKKGENGSGGPVYFVRTDAERWIFSRIIMINGSATAQHSREYRVDLRKLTESKVASANEIFNWIRFLIQSGRDSSPRASLQSLDQTIEYDDGLTKDIFNDMEIN